MVPEETTEDPRKVFEALLATSHEQASAWLAEQHPGDAADWLADVDAEDSWIVFSSLDTEAQAELLEFAEDALRAELIARMSAGDLRELVEALPSDEAADLLAEADQRVAEDALAGMDDESAQELRELASYDPETAGGLMATEIVSIPSGMRVGDAVKAIRKAGEDAEEELGVFVIDPAGCPIGYLTDRALLTHPIHDHVDEVMSQAFTLPVGADQEEVARSIEKYGLQVLGVVDAAGVLIGVISEADAAEVVGDEAEEDIARMVGTSPGHQQTRLPILVRVRQRLPLMGLTVLGGILSAKILSYFVGDDGVHAGVDGNASITDILRYLPLIVGIAGNVGVQSSTILVRAFATGEVERNRELRVLGSEVTVGIIIGLLCGMAVCLISSRMEMGLWLDPFGVAVGVAVAAAVATAAIFGCVIPMGCRRLGIDPAIVAGPVLICISDIAGSVIYIVTAQALVGFE
ncbi:MAG: magnesium transporter [Planctomycetota bacterium]|jgi:magnesium transporter